MIRIILLILMLTTSISTYAQTTSANAVNKSIETSNKTFQQTDSLLLRIDSLIQITNLWLEHIELGQSLKNRYKLYPTENIYTFLELDTKTGIIKQVHWSLDSDKEGSVTINAEDLNYLSGYGSNSFELYPTKNMYQFILLEKTTGRKWHVQWGMEYSKRWIRRIY